MRESYQLEKVRFRGDAQTSTRLGSVGLYFESVDGVRSCSMAEGFVKVDREPPRFLPPDLREWVADNELAHLVLEAVELCDVRGARLNVGGSGSEQYPPTMMLALLIYAYATPAV